MTTKQELIEQAAEEFGVTSAFGLSPEELQSGLARLNRLAAQWDGMGVRVGYSFGGGLEDSAGIPDTAENAFALNLAVQWGPSFGKAISLETKVAAKAAFNALLTARALRPQTQLPAHLPMGAGSRRGVREQQYFQPSEEVPGLNEGATEY